MRSTGANSDSVLLELWLDKNDNGTWELVHSLLDEQGTMPADPRMGPVPSECAVQSGDPVLGPKQSCFLQRSIGGMPLFKLLTLPAGLESPSIWSVVPHRARLVVAHFAVDSPEDDRLAAEITSRRTQASAPKIYHLVAE